RASLTDSRRSALDARPRSELSFIKRCFHRAVPFCRWHLLLDRSVSQRADPIFQALYLHHHQVGREGSKKLVRPIDLGLPYFQPDSYTRVFVSHGSISCQPLPLIST